MTDMNRRLPIAIFMMASILVPTSGGQARRDPLKSDEADQVAEMGDRPFDRLKLYVKYIEQRISDLKQLTAVHTAEHRTTQIHAKLDEFTRLADELQDNLDTLADRHSDIRKSLKELGPVIAKWPEVLNATPPDPLYDFSRKTALEATDSLTEQTKKLLEEQEAYFKEHPDEKGKNGTGPDAPPKQ
jgi:hypothetical protein